MESHDYRHLRLEYLTSKQVASYLKDNDLAILPVGCTEMHGSNLPLGTDTIQDHAMALILAEQWNCLCLPPIPYVYTGASEYWPGTISISPDESLHYVRAVAVSAVRAGFRRLVVSASHGPMGFIGESLVRSVYRDTGEIVLFLSPYSRIMEMEEEEFGRGSEDANTLGAIKLLGMHEGLDFSADRDVDSSFPFDSLAKLRRMGARLPWVFNRDHQHAGLRSDLKPEDADRSIACMKRAAATMKDLPGLFSQYREEMERLMEQQPWTRDDIWSM